MSVAHSFKWKLLYNCTLWQIFVWKSYCKQDARKGSGKTRRSWNATRGIQMLLSNSRGKIAWTYLSCQKEPSYKWKSGSDFLLAFHMNLTCFQPIESLNFAVYCKKIQQAMPTICQGSVKYPEVTGKMLMKILWMLNHSSNWERDLFLSLTKTCL